MDKTWTVVLVFIGIFAAGLVVGGLVTLRVVKYFAPPRLGSPEQFGPQLIKRFTTKLELTPDQQEKIKPIITQGAEELRQMRRTAWINSQAVIDRMEAEGPVYLVTSTQKAQADHATYLAASDTVIMSGNVVLLQDKNVVKGEKLVIEHTTGHSTLYASPKVENGRVRGVFYPKDDAAPAKPH